MNSLLSYFSKGVYTTFLLGVYGAHIAAQKPPAKASRPEPSFLESYGLYLGIVALISLIAAIVRVRKKKAAVAIAVPPKGGSDGIRLRFKKKAPAREKTPERFAKEKPAIPSAVLLASTTSFAALPISNFAGLQRTNPYLRLPESHDPDLLAAIEHTNEESEEDIQVRSRALKLLATFQTSNAVFAIGQIALYDLSSKMRADAVAALAEIDHESVFETIVTACADPTREVRAAAARGLVKLTFDRANAWTRIIESGNTSRMRHAARCAIEGDLVQRFLDRLVHTDRNVAYEAYALTALLILSGETEPIFTTLVEHRDEYVKLALLHVLQTVKHENTFDGLSDLLTTYNLSPNIAAKVNEVRSSLLMAHA